jgi:hypothetical protein
MKERGRGEGIEQALSLSSLETPRILGVETRRAASPLLSSFGGGSESCDPVLPRARSPSSRSPALFPSRTLPQDSSECPLS